MNYGAIPGAKQTEWHRSWVSLEINTSRWSIRTQVNSLLNAGEHDATLHCHLFAPQVTNILLYKTINI